MEKIERTEAITGHFELGKKMKIEVCDITPDVATKLLAMNTRNRPLNKGQVGKISDAILRGDWRLNGDAIRVSITGVLLDGQHRLHAILLSGKTVSSVIVYGLPDEVFDTIDTQRNSRTTGDILSLEGNPNANVLAAVASLCHKLNETGNPYDSGRRAPTAQQTKTFIAATPSLHESVSFGTRNRTSFITQTMLAFCHHKFSQSGAKNLAAPFLESLITGASLAPSSVVLLLRNKLIENASAKAKEPPRAMCAMVFKAFRVYAEGRTLKLLRVNLSGDQQEVDLFRLPVSK